MYMFSVHTTIPNTSERVATFQTGRRGAAPFLSVFPLPVIRPTQHRIHIKHTCAIHVHVHSTHACIYTYLHVLRYMYMHVHDMDSTMTHTVDYDMLTFSFSDFNGSVKPHFTALCGTRRHYSTIETHIHVHAYTGMYDCSFTIGIRSVTNMVQFGSDPPLRGYN